MTEDSSKIDLSSSAEIGDPISSEEKKSSTPLPVRDQASSPIFTNLTKMHQASSSFRGGLISRKEYLKNHVKVESYDKLNELKLMS